jgi:hypothetical protein
MALNMSVKQFVVWQRLNDLNHYLLYFPEENPRLDQASCYILLLAKAPELHEAIVNSNFEIFEMSYEESISSIGEFGKDQAHQRSQSFLSTSR